MKETNTTIKNYLYFHHILFGHDQVKQKNAQKLK